MTVKIPPLRPLRCSQCGRRLGDFHNFLLGYRIRCPRCGHMNSKELAINTTSVTLFFAILDNMNGNTPDNVAPLAVEFLQSSKQT